MRLRSIAFLTVLLLPIAHLDRASAIGAGPWAHPVAGPIVRFFEPPPCPFCAGHLGIDYRVDPGTPVRSVGAGTVVFAGSVGGTRHVVVAHPGELRTTYAFVATILVRRGQRVRVGQLLATSGGTGANHDGRVLHLGLRIGEQYIDPALLFRRLDLVAAVRLVPLARASARHVACGSGPPVPRRYTCARSRRAGSTSRRPVSAVRPPNYHPLR